MNRALPTTLLALFSGTATAATLTVGPTGTYATIQEAIDDAANGDVIEVEDGDYPEQLVIDGQAIQIQSLNGSGSTSISGNGGNSLVVCLSSALTLEGFEMIPDGGRAIDISGGSDVTMIDLVAVGFDISSFFDDGAVILSNDSDFEVWDSWFENNRAEDGSVARLNNSDATFINVDMHGGDVDDDGGVIRADNSALTVIDSRVSDNTASADGGAFYMVGFSDISLIDSSFTNNSAGSVGGTVRSATGGQDEVNTFVSGCSFDGNTGTYGGAVYHRGDGSLEIRDSTFSNNTADGYGGNGGALRLFPDGGNPLMLIEDNVFKDNVADDRGGAIAFDHPGYGEEGELEIIGNQFWGGDATRGGGVSFESMSSTLAIGNIFCDNYGTNSSGGARIGDGSSAGNLWTNNVFIENSTGNVGGGFAALNTATVDLLNNTFTGNDAVDGGGLYFEGTSGSLVNNIVANTVNGGGISADNAGGVRDYNLWFNNLASDAAGALGAGDLGNNAVYSDPMFTNYSQDGVCGNDLLTLDPGSPAIDSGDPGIQDNDGGPSDIGAYGGPNLEPGALDDNDGDGWPEIADCDDNDYDVNPDAAEVCDGVDNDCNGDTDGSDASGATDWFPDADSDGYGDDAAVVTQCDSPGPNWISDGGDCDDGDDTVNPDATEVCDNLDNDCDGTVDDGLTTTYYPDADGDGFGDESAPVDTCEDPDPDLTTEGGDCDDGNNTIFPGAEEICDGIDNNCDGEADEGLIVTWYRDADEDGYGTDDKTLEDCLQPDGYAPESGDCDDADPEVNPGVPDETADQIDQNCDGVDGSKFAEEELLLNSGCGCNSASGTGATGWLAIGVALLLARRRRQ